ncbi:protein-L-isoaspartate O-methyltransferase [Sphingomonas sp.]|uniref:protein-L-isoaspartate O-methyltransferase family protein n=1 Tax=Sphingomonas sp. TaxID=28214 RepID=UPI001ED79061|nr:protein-L-isoaspartate O-methyltransferase [Sphingomonas sp.]MBX3593841.1 protein-L-isoaspartate O-methyltransferase [Sphingomonas sp.]
MMTATANSFIPNPAREAMVASQLRTSGVSDARVVAAMNEVAREDYVPERHRGLAYRDRPLPLGGGRMQNPPLATGLLLTQAGIAAGDRVLIVGAAGGYAAAIAAKLGAKVIALESDGELAARARAALGGVADVAEGPLMAGWPAGAPYDVLIVDGAVEVLPDALVAQVRVGGRIVAGLLERGVTRLAAGVRTEGGFGLTAFADSECAVLPGFEAPQGFRF